MGTAAPDLRFGDVIGLLQAVHRNDGPDVQDRLVNAADAPALAISALSYVLTMLDQQMDKGISLAVWLNTIASTCPDVRGQHHARDPVAVMDALIAEVDADLDHEG